jgi:hypothetical protein
MRDSKFYPFIYRSYWHYLIKKRNSLKIRSSNYFSSRPNPGAGIGHQIANWLAGYWFANQFGLRFAHLPFSDQTWDGFLGFGYNEISVTELVKKHKFRIVLLPLFDEKNFNEVNLIKNIIKSYQDRKIVFVTEQDQFYKDQFGVMDVIQKKFYNSPFRLKDKVIFSPENFNIAIHVRRGDILSDITNPNLSKRFNSNFYFLNVLQNSFNLIKTHKPIHIYFFSQGIPDDFPEFNKIRNLHWCMDMNTHDSFLHMVFSDLLITSKSSFSYKPALLNRGIKIVPENFWHSYPNRKDWILADLDGNILTTYVVDK